MEVINNINNETHEIGNGADPAQMFKDFSDEEMEKIKLLAGLLGIGNQQQMVKEAVTVDRGFSEYNKLIEFNLAKKTVASVKTAERRFLEFISLNRPLNSIERKDAENLLMKISKSAPLGCYNYLKVYRTIFNVFVDWNYVSSNPFLKVKLPKRQKDEPVVFTRRANTNCL